MYKPQPLPIDFDFETKTVLKAVTEAKSALFELKGFVHVIPNQSILINTLALQEAKDSSAVENIITTHDEIYKADLDKEFLLKTSTKEVHSYKEALYEGVKMVKASQNLITNECVLSVQANLEQNKAGYRKIQGTVLKNDKTGEVVYKPPQDSKIIESLMGNLLEYLNMPELHDVDPLIKMAVAHHQFESIHPFYDGNGRTGRILNILHLIANNYIDLPVLYLSRYIIQSKDQYYRELQSVRDNGTWEKWVLYMLEGIKLTALDTIWLINKIKSLMQDYKTFLRSNFSFYSQDLLNNLFRHPYTKIDFVKKDLGITRQTASKYLTELASHPSGYVRQVEIGKFSYFVNVKLFELLSQERSLMLKKS